MWCVRYVAVLEYKSLWETAQHAIAISIDVVNFKYQDEWYCDKCHKMDNGAMESSQGGQIESQGPLKGCDLIKEKKTILSDLCHGNKKFSAPSVKQYPESMTEGIILTMKGAAMPLVHPSCTRVTDQGKHGSQIEDEPDEKTALITSGADHGCESEIKRLHHKIGTPVVINSSVEYARRPPPESCWTGYFHVFYGRDNNVGAFEASFPSKVSQKVCDIVKKMPNNLQLEMLPRMNEWPECFDTNPPVYEDIALFFFPNELNQHDKKYPHLLESSCNFVLKAYVGSRKLLIFSSEVLPPDSHVFIVSAMVTGIDGENYLWGIFVKSEGRSNPARFGSAAA
ncbi:hypothetical protein ACP70R_012200 [Stipagrostis hirtigluma subsp. patula]